MNEPTSEDDRTVQPHGEAVSMGNASLRAGFTEEPESGDRLPIGMRLAEFEIIGYVGDGGFSIVYLAWDHSLERQVALKEYMPSSLASRSGGTRVFPRSERHRDTFALGLKSFINEGKLLAQFDHPSLVKVYRFWEAHGTAYMVMPYYEGLTLKDTVRAMSQPPDEAWLRGLLDPLMAALSVIHQAQCFHRDIAPDNVMLLAGNGKPLLLDFGAARRVIGDKTQALTVILKPGYAPVEQYAEDPTMRQGAWTDVYALAAVIYWAVTGKTPPASVGRVLNDSYVPLVQSAAGRYSARFLAAVDRALIVLPESRTPSIERLREELGLGVAWPEAPAAPPPEDLEVTVIRPTPTPAAPHMRIEPNAPLPAAKSQSTASRVDSPKPKPKPQDMASASGGMRLWLSLAGIAVLAVGTGLWWISQPSIPPASTTASAPSPSTAPAPVPRPANPSPALPAAPQPSPPSAQTMLTQIDAGRDASIALKATLVTERNGATRLQFQASEGGYAYVLGSRTDNNALVMLYPSPGGRAAKLGKNGKVNVPLPTAAGVQTYYMLWARESRDLSESGWSMRDSGWVRILETSVAPNAAATVWGAPHCAPRAKRCDPAYAMTEVTDMTNVTIPAQGPVLMPSANPKSPTPAPEKTATKRRENFPPTEEKPPPRRDDGLSAQCRELLNRASLGDTGADLIEKMKTLRCGN
jgi:serine/threonine protein kinase